MPIIALIIYIYSEVLMAVNNSLQRAVDEACETITSTCDENQWLTDVWRFVSSWQGRSKVTSMSAEELEVHSQYPPKIYYYCLISRPHFKIKTLRMRLEKYSVIAAFFVAENLQLSL